MKKRNTKASRFSKKQIVLLFIVGIVVVLAGSWGWNQVAPRPLGDDLTYIGKKDSGGWFIKSSSSYYYGTNLSSDEMKEYFTHANFDESSKEINSVGLNYASKGFRFISSNGDKFIITYYSDVDTVVSAFELHSSDHRYVISITSSDYDIARESL